MPLMLYPEVRDQAREAVAELRKETPNLAKIETILLRIIGQTPIRTPDYDQS